MKYVEKINNGKRIIPTMVFSDGSILVEPSNAELAEKLGINTKAQRQFYDTIIVGSGPTGLTAGLYMGREGMDTLVIEKGGIGGRQQSPKPWIIFLVLMRGFQVQNSLTAWVARRTASELKSYRLMKWFQSSHKEITGARSPGMALNTVAGRCCWHRGLATGSWVSQVKII